MREKSSSLVCGHIHFFLAAEKSMLGHIACFAFSESKSIKLSTIIRLMRQTFAKTRMVQSKAFFKFLLFLSYGEMLGKAN